MKKEKESRPQLQAARFYIVRNTELEQILGDYNLHETAIITGGGSLITLDKQEILQNQQQELTNLINQLSKIRESYQDGSAVLAMYWIYQGKVNKPSYLPLTPAYFNFFGKKKIITEKNLRDKKFDKQLGIKEFVDNMGFEAPHKAMNKVLPLKAKVLTPNTKQWN